jgi:glucosamine-6-phosphate deaminase
MRIIVVNDYEKITIAAARFVAGQIYLKPNSVLGLPAGSTSVGVYKQLIKWSDTIGMNFSEVKTFSPDEYIGLGKDDKNSIHYFMQDSFFDHINIRSENIHIPNGEAKDIEAECRHYDELIERAGGIDLQILGIGNNAHVGFNEPDIKFQAATHQVRLDDETLEANARFFETIYDVPRFAISIGIKPIMYANRVVLLASGEQKAEAIRKTVKGAVRPDVPASILQLHRDATLIVDEAAASRL